MCTSHILTSGEDENLLLHTVHVYTPYLSRTDCIKYLMYDTRYMVYEVRSMVYEVQIDHGDIYKNMCTQYVCNCLE